MVILGPEWGSLKPLLTHTNGFDSLYLFKARLVNAPNTLVEHGHRRQAHPHVGGEKKSPLSPEGKGLADAEKKSSKKIEIGLDNY